MFIELNDNSMFSSRYWEHIIDDCCNHVLFGDLPESSGWLVCIENRMFGQAGLFHCPYVVEPERPFQVFCLYFLLLKFWESSKVA